MTIRLLGEIGAEVLVETARLWADLGFYGADKKFHVHGVTGPDEYTTVVNDNTYTNLMARLNLNFAAATVRRLREERPRDYTALVHTVRLQPREAEAWERAAAAMHIPFDEDTPHPPPGRDVPGPRAVGPGRHPAGEVPAAAALPPAGDLPAPGPQAGRHRARDVPARQRVPQEQKRRNFDYYDALTTGDSSLSACVQGIIAAEIGNERQALEYFQYALLMDLGNVAGNASDGVHIASAAGVWSSLVFGFGGVRDFDGHSVLQRPGCPAPGTSSPSHSDSADAKSESGSPTTRKTTSSTRAPRWRSTIRGEPHLLSPGTTVTIKLTPP